MARIMLKFNCDLTRLFLIILVKYLLCDSANGFDCANNSMYTREGSVATFYANVTDFSNGRYLSIDIHMKNVDFKFRLFTTLNGNWSELPIRKDIMDSRFSMYWRKQTDKHLSLKLMLDNIRINDSGTYAIRDRYHMICDTWILFVVGIQKHPGSKITEGSTVSFQGNPTISAMKRHDPSAGRQWTLDGVDMDQYLTLRVIDDTLWIPRVSREMQGMTVTYRCIEDSGQVTEVSITLWVLYIDTGHPDMEEDSAVLFRGYPPVRVVNSRLTHSGTNSTILWLLDGSSLSETVQFAMNSAVMWIPRVTREMEGWNVTYRIIEDTGEVSEANITLSVSYGPNWPVRLTPGRRTYVVCSGDMIPDVTCYVDCNPPCNISWGSHSSTAVLNLGHISMETEGQYSCTATRVGSTNTVEESIYVYVKKDALQLVPLVVLTCVHASITIAALVAVCICMRCRRSCNRQRSKPGDGGANMTHDEHQMSVVQGDIYEPLNPATRELPVGSNYPAVDNAEYMYA